MLTAAFYLKQHSVPSILLFAYQMRQCPSVSNEIVNASDAAGGDVMLMCRLTRRSCAGRDMAWRGADGVVVPHPELI